MIDFSKYLTKEKEPKEQLPEKEITACFTKRTGDWDKKKQDFVNIQKRARAKTIKMRIEEGTNGSIVRFIGSSTGHESFYIDSLLKTKKRSEHLCLCAGTINSWEECLVNWQEVKDFIEPYK